MIASFFLAVARWDRRGDVQFVAGAGL